MSKETDNHERMFEDFSIAELKDTIVRRWKEIKSLEAEKKDTVKAISDTIKELSAQIDSLVYWIGIKETAAAREELEKAATEHLGE